MAQTWNDPTLPWQTWDGTNLPWKDPAMAWNNLGLPWKDIGSGDLETDALIQLTDDAGNAMTTDSP